MSQPILIKSTGIQGRVPTVSQVQIGELALNHYDGKLYTKRDQGAGGEIVEIGAPYTHPTSGVTAGTYRAVTVDANGHITAGSNPTTLAGYGIADATPLSHVGASGSAHAAATAAATGFMSAADKTKLDGVEAQANKYVHPTSTVTPGMYFVVTVDANGHVTGGSNPTTLAGYGITDAAPSSHVGAGSSAHSTATSAAAGFMSAADKAKLDLLDPAASSYTHPTSGVTAGTYRAVTVDANGHVTGGSNPTTLAGYGITDAQPLDADLTATAAISVNGLVARTAAGSAAARSFAASGNGLSVTNADGVAGNPTLVSNASSSNTASTIISRDASGNFSAGTITAALSGNASTTTKTVSAYTLAGTGDLTFLTGTFDGSANAMATAALANSGATAGSYGTTISVPSVTVDAKGRITGVSSADIQSSTTAQSGVVQLNSTVSSTSTALAATASVVKTAYDVAAAAIPASQKGAANGVASLGADGKIPTGQLPSYVDDILEFASTAAFPASGITGKIYIAQDTSKTYRWTGTQYVEVSPTASNFDTTTKLTTARSIAFTGDLTGSIASFDGSANASAAGTLASSGATAGTYKSVTVDAKGRVTAGSNPTTLSGYGITDAQPLDADLTAVAALSTVGMIVRTGTSTFVTRSLGVSGGGLTVTNADTNGGNPTVNSNATSANTASAIVSRDASGNFSAGTITATLTGNASTATKLTTPRTISLSGDITWSSGNFDGSANVSGVAALANSGVTAGTYKSVTVDAKGRTTAGSNPTTLAGYGITDAAPINSPTFTGVPTAPTAVLVNDTSSTQVANRQLVQNAISQYVDAFGSPMVRQTIQNGRVDTSGYANFLEPYGDATTKHLVHFNSEDTYLSNGAVVFTDQLYRTGLLWMGNYWKTVNGASYVTTGQRFGSACLQLDGGATRYCQQVGTSLGHSNRTAWTEEFWWKPGTATGERRLFRVLNSKGYGIVMYCNAAGKLQMYLSSDGTSWNLASASVGTTVISNGAWHHIAMVFDGDQYRVYVDGQLDWSLNTQLKICATTYRMFGHSSNSCQGWIDEYRFSYAVLYTTAFTPPATEFVYLTSKQVNVSASAEIPVVASFSNEVQEIRTFLTQSLLTADLVPNNTNFIYLDYNTATGVVSVGSTLIPPQYGSKVSTDNMSLLTFADLAPTDDYGNTWLDTNVTYNAGPLAGVSNYASFNGTSSYMQSDIYALPSRFTLRAKVYFNTLPNDSACIFSFSSVASNGYGLVLRVDNSKLDPFISTTGKDFNIVNGTDAYTTLAINTWYDIELSYDGANYKLYVNGILNGIWASTGDVTCADNSLGVLTLGRYQTGSYLNGNIAEFELLPYVKHGDGTTLGSSVFTPQAAKSTAPNPGYHFFDISRMVMSTMSDASGIPGVQPAFDTIVRRVFVGEATLDSTKVTAVRTYALNGSYVSGWFPVAVSNTYVKDHNLGCDLLDVHNFFNDIPRDYKRVEEVGHSMYSTSTTDGYGTTTTTYYYFGTRRTLDRTTLELATSANGLLPKPYDRPGGYFNVMVRRKF